jgi:hypothetical protein
MKCPSCRKGVRRLSKKSGTHDAFECPACHLVYRISGTARRAIENGRRFNLVKDVSGQIWLRPDNWPS